MSGSLWIADFQFPISDSSSTANEIGNPQSATENVWRRQNAVRAQTAPTASSAKKRLISCRIFSE
jgi:hypothetical protein